MLRELCGVSASFGLDGPTLILTQIESCQHMLRGTEETTAARVLLLCHNAMAAGPSSRSFSRTALPATVLESESMGRERRERVFHFGGSGHG